MKVVLLEHACGPEGLTIREIDTPLPAAGEVRVKLKASALNRRDYWITLGKYPQMRLPCVTGSDGAGIVEAIGEGVDPYILDAGCGSGRDAHYFIQQGFNVTAFDASEALVLKAREFTGLEVSINTFENFKCANPDCLFDAIWACASLLHVPSDQLPASFSNLSVQLKQGGLFYCSFKLGSDDVTRNGRSFTNADEKRLASFIQNTSLSIDKTWITEDVRPNRQDEKWLNAILIKV